jgi:RAB protein geranylgeranyltransferase component A
VARPPKTKQGPSATQVKKAKDKIVEDKTFGLKNKGKSKKVQQYVQQVKQQTDMKMAKYDKDRDAAKLRRQQIKEEEKQKELLNQTLFKARCSLCVLASSSDPFSCRVSCFLSVCSAVVV